MPSTAVSSPLAELLGRRRVRLRVTVLPFDAAEHRAAVLAAAERAIRDYREPARLAVNPLARGATPHARAEHVRALVDEAVALTFGMSDADAALREVVVAGYLVAAAPHERLADDLYLSRSTYFRRLAAGLRRVTAQLAEAQAASVRASAERELMPSFS